MMKRFFLAIFADGGRGPPVARKGSGTPLPGGDQHRGGKKRLERQQTKAQGTEHSASNYSIRRKQLPESP